MTRTRCSAPSQLVQEKTAVKTLRALAALVSLAIVASPAASQNPPAAPPAAPLAFVGSPALYLLGMMPPLADATPSWNANFAAEAANGAVKVYRADGTLARVVPHEGGLHPTFFSADESNVAVVTARGNCAIYPIGKGEPTPLDEKSLVNNVITAGFVPGCPTWLVVSTMDQITFVEIGPRPPTYFTIPIGRIWRRYTDIHLEFTIGGPSLVITFGMRGSVILDVDLQNRKTTRHGD
jgi:hypothetical protein